MTYPKPLSEKSLAKLYRESGLGDDVCSFLHDLFAACVNLYGVIDLQSIWGLYQKMQNEPKFRRKDLVSFSSIVRRENQRYYVFEIEELYEDEPHNDLHRHIVFKDIIGYGYGKFGQFYDLLDQLDDKPYCIPDDFLSYAVPTPSKEETDLLSFLSTLVSTARICRPQNGKSIPNTHRGMKLGEFSFLNSYERFDYEWLQKRPAAQQAFMDSVAGTEAEKIVRHYKLAENLGKWRPSEIIQFLLDELSEVGVELKDKQVNKLMQLLTEYHNNSRLWCTMGWKPNELAKIYHKRPTAVSFGPGLQRAFAEGSISKEELIKMIREMGLDVMQ